MITFKVAEKFVSINGEGRRAGELAVFVRFAGCNLRCAYCDTAWAWEFDAPAEEMTADEIYAYIKQTGVRNVTLTGGEPLLRDGIMELLQILAADDELSVEIETNGTQDLQPIIDMDNRPHLTVDYKLPGSGMEEQMHRESLWLLDGRDVVKFVCADIADMQRAVQVINDNDLMDRVWIYFSPVFGRINPADMVEFIKEQNLNGVTLQLQLHKFIWPPEARGV